jgi:hypothetical protein
MAGCGGIAHTGGKMLRSAPTVADVDRIVALGDPIVRNLQITQCYHELASTLATMTGSTANWCTFATWASKQAGQTIRREDLARTFENTIAKSPEVSEIKDYVVASARRVGSRRDATGIRVLASSKTTSWLRRGVSVRGATPPASGCWSSMLYGRQQLSSALATP